MIPISYKGKKYKSITALAKAYGVNPAKLTHRIRAHWTIEDAINTESNYRIEAQDHEGRKFPSLNAMTDFWGIDYQVFMDRFNRGWEIAKALTTPVKTRAA